MKSKLEHLSVTSVTASVGETLTTWSSRRRAVQRSAMLDELEIVDGVRFGVKLVVGLGPQTRFRIEWWHRLVADMQRKGQRRVVIGLEQVEWLLAQVPAAENVVVSEEE